MLRLLLLTVGYKLPNARVDSRVPGTAVLSLWPNGLLVGIITLLVSLIGYALWSDRYHNKKACDSYITNLEKENAFLGRLVTEYRTQLFEERQLSQEATTTALAVAK